MAERENGRRNAGKMREEEIKKAHRGRADISREQKEYLHRQERRQEMNVPEDIRKEEKARRPRVKVSHPSATQDPPMEYAQTKKKVDREIRRQRHRERRENRGSRNLGLVLFVLQVMFSGIFAGLLVWLDMLPGTYIAMIFAALLALAAITLVSQLMASGKGIPGKVFSVIVMLVVTIGGFYVYRMSDTLNRVANTNYKVDTIVVAVMEEDKAENLKDAADYVFGVQYRSDGDKVRKAVEQISEEIGKDIEVKEFESVVEQAQALHDGQVGAIIYNEGHQGILSEVFEGYNENVKVIYKHSVKTEIGSLSLHVSVDSDPFTVYISGNDVYGELENNSRSDVNIIAVVNPKSHQILLVTTPRDYYVEIPGISYGNKDKLTHAGIYGVDASMRTLEALYETKIPFYARINFTSMIEIVDILGGIDVESEYAFTTSGDSEHVFDVSKGMNHFNGKEALAFSRERQHLEDGDNQRGKNQQAVIIGMINKMLRPDMIVKANSILDSVAHNVDTNMSNNQIASLIKNQLESGAKWKVYSVAAEGVGSEDVCWSMGAGEYYVTLPDDSSVEKIKELINRVENGETIEDSVETE